MVIDCLSVFLVDFDYLWFCRGKVSFFLLPFLSCIQFLLFWYSIFSILCTLFSTTCARAPRGLLYGTELYSCCTIDIEDMEGGVGRGGGAFVKFLPLPFLNDGG